MHHIPIYVLDNSVICKPLLGEEGAELVEKIFYRKENFETLILLPEIFRFEFLSTVTRKKGPEIARDAYFSFIERQVRIIPNEIDLIDSTLHLMNRYNNITFYDASYHALAKAYNAPFITADKKYFQATHKEGNIIWFFDLKI